MIAHRGLNNKYTNGGESLMRAGVIVYHGIIERLTTLWTLTYCLRHMGGKVNRLNDTSTQKTEIQVKAPTNM